MRGVASALRARSATVLVAAAAAVVVLVVAGVVSASPAGDEPPGAFTTDFGDGEVAVALQPAAVGANEVHLYITDAGGSLRGVTAPQVTIGDGAGDGRRINVTSVAPGHLLAVQQHLGEPGAHTVAVEATIDGLPQRASGTVEVRESAGLARRVVEWCTLQLSRAR